MRKIFNNNFKKIDVYCKTTSKIICINASIVNNKISKLNPNYHYRDSTLWTYFISIDFKKFEKECSTDNYNSCFT